MVKVMMKRWKGRILTDFLRDIGNKNAKNLGVRKIKSMRIESFNLCIQKFSYSFNLNE